MTWSDEIQKIKEKIPDLYLLSVLTRPSHSNDSCAAAVVLDNDTLIITLFLR
jgi:hypothetical protein